jgi:hypothetical protein
MHMHDMHMLQQNLAFTHRHGWMQQYYLPLSKDKVKLTFHFADVYTAVQRHVMTVMSRWYNEITESEPVQE